MANALDRIIDALSHDNIKDDYWWNIVGSVTEAKKLISEAFKETPSKSELIFLINILEINDNNISNINLYYKCLNELRRELILVES